MQLLKFILLSLFPRYFFFHVLLDKLVIFNPISDLQGFLKKLIKIKWLKLTLFDFVDKSCLSNISFTL